MFSNDNRMQHIGKTLATTSTASTLFQKLCMPSSISRTFPGSHGCNCYKVGPVILIYLHTHIAGVIPAITAPSISTVESVEPKYTLLSLSLSHCGTLAALCSITFAHRSYGVASLTALTVSLRSPLLRCHFAHRSYGVGVISPFNLAWLLLCSIASLTASGSVGVFPSKVHVVFFALLRFRFRFRFSCKSCICTRTVHLGSAVALHCAARTAGACSSLWRNSFSSFAFIVADLPA